MAKKYILTLHSTRTPIDEEHLKGWCQEMAENYGFDVAFDLVREGCEKRLIKHDEHGETHLSVRVIQ